MATMQMVEVWIPMLDGRWLMLRRYTQAEKGVQAMLNKLDINLPCQPPPRIKSPLAPGGHGELANEDFLGGSGGLVLGLERVDQSIEICGVFKCQDKGFADRPCLTPLRRTAARPSGVIGPVLFCAFSRLAAICRSEAISGYLPILGYGSCQGKAGLKRVFLLVKLFGWRE